MPLLTNIDMIFVAVFGFFMIYLLMLSLLALAARTHRTFTARHFRRFAMVIPAHNEELSIASTLNSLTRITYNKANFDIIVVADNCSDRTADLARTAGGVVYERSNSTLRGKGHALRWIFDQLLDKQPPYDAIVVIDADTVAAPDFLTVMNYYLEQGSSAVQCSDMVAPQPGSWSSEITRLGFTLYNHVRPLGRRVMNCPAGLRGNGMCFSTETLRKIPWNTFSLNEDLEYGLVLLLNGISVDFASEAKVYATMPSNSRNAESQRSRWERGRLPMIKRYGGRLLAAAIKSFAFRPFDAFIDLVTPPFVNLFAGVLVVFIVHVVVLLMGLQPMTIWFVAAWGLLVLSGVAHVLIGLYAADADAVLYKSFFHIPRYVIWKFVLYAKSFRRQRAQEWVRTSRDQPVEHKTARGTLKNH